MHLLPAIATLLSISSISTPAAAKSTSSTPSGDHQIFQYADSSSAQIISRRNSQIASQLAEGPALGVRKMSDDEGEKFFLDYWDFAGASDAAVSQVSENFNETLMDRSVDDGYSPARFVGQTFPFGPSTPPAFGDSLQARHFKCPIGTWACTSIGRSDRCCGSGETCEIVSDTGHGNVGCCAQGKTCTGMIGSCAVGYTACAEALGGGCCIPGYHCVEGGCESTALFSIWLDTFS